MATSYNKPHLRVEQQIELLRSRGLAIDDYDSASHWLHMVGYYRLSGYWYPYRALAADLFQREDRFIESASLDQVTSLYDFDRRLKLLVLDAVERVEISMRFRVGYTLGRRGAFAHLDTTNLDAAFDGIRRGRTATRYSEWRERLAKEQARSSEDFVQHFRAKYGDQLPVWVVTEILDFGGLSVLFSGLKRADRDEIAAGLAIYGETGVGNGRALANWMHVLNYIRNVCAHHSRLWNRNLTVQLATKHLAAIGRLGHLRSGDPTLTARIFGPLCVLDFLMTSIDPAHTWTKSLCEVIATRLPASGRDIREMGFPTGWQTRLL